MNFTELVTSSGLFCDGDWIEKKDQDPNGTVRLIQLADIGACEFKDKSNHFITESKAKELNCTYLHQGDILIARLPDPLGRACIFPFEGKYITAVDVAIVRISRADVNPKYVMYMINSPKFREKIKQYESGTTRKRISRKNLDKIGFEIPPLGEQNRIVARIEELFSELDNGVETLKKTKQQLAVYRQAVLVTAFECIENVAELDTLADMIDPQPSHRTPPEVLDGIPYIGIGDINYKEQHICFENARKVGHNVLNEHRERYKIHAGDFVMGKIGTIGKPFRLPFPQN